MENDKAAGAKDDSVTIYRAPSPGRLGAAECTTVNEETQHPGEEGCRHAAVINEVAYEVSSTEKEAELWGR